MVRLSLVLFIAQIALGACALISCLSAERQEIRALPRVVWVLLILFFPLIGSIAWFIAGRPVRVDHPTGGGRPTLGGPPDRDRPRQVAPDDDPEFLKSLSEGQAGRDREMFERWEQDLRRREDDLRRKEGGDPPFEDNRPEA
jgi:hypothetical protein